MFNIAQLPLAFCPMLLATVFVSSWPSKAPWLKYETERLKRRLCHRSGDHRVDLCVPQDFAGIVAESFFFGRGFPLEPR